MKALLKGILLVTFLASVVACQGEGASSAGSAPEAPEKVVLELEGAGQ